VSIALLLIFVGDLGTSTVLHFKGSARRAAEARARGLPAIVVFAAWTCVAGFAAITLLTTAYCGQHGWCGGTDGDAWMPAFFMAFPALWGWDQISRHRKRSGS
jgi:hypothetical protein